MDNNSTTLLNGDSTPVVQAQVISVGQIQKGKLVRVEVCNAPDGVQEYEGVPYAVGGVPTSSSEFVAETDGYIVFVPLGGGTNG